MALVVERYMREQELWLRLTGQSANQLCRRYYRVDGLQKKFAVNKVSKDEEEFEFLLSNEASTLTKANASGVSRVLELAERASTLTDGCCLVLE